MGEYKRQKNIKLMQIIIFIIFVVVTLVGAIGIGIYNRKKNSNIVLKELAKDWGDKYFEFLEQAIISKNEDYGFSEKASEQNIIFIESNNQKEPYMAINYVLNEKAKTVIFYIENEDIKSYVPKQESEIQFLYDINKKEYNWFLITRDEEGTIELTNLYSLIENNAKPEYVYHINDEKKVEEEVIANIIKDNKIVFAETNSSIKLRKAIRDILSNFKTNKELITEEMQTIVNNRVIEIENLKKDRLLNNAYQQVNSLVKEKWEKAKIETVFNNDEAYYYFKVSLGEDVYTLIVNKEDSQIYYLEEDNKHEVDENNITDYLKINTYIGEKYKIVLKDDKLCDFTVDENESKIDEEVEYKIDNGIIIINLKDATEYQFIISNFNKIVLSSKKKKLQVEKYTLEYGKYVGIDGTDMIGNQSVTWKVELELKEDGTYTLKTSNYSNGLQPTTDTGKFDITNLDNYPAIELSEGGIFWITANNKIQNPAENGTVFELEEN